MCACGRKWISALQQLDSNAMLLRCLASVMYLCVIALPVFAQQDGPPASRYIGPITNKQTLYPPASQYIGKVKASASGLNPSSTQSTSNNNITQAIEYSPTRTKSVTQVQSLSDDENQFFVPPLRGPLEAPSQLNQESTGTASLPNSPEIQTIAGKPVFQKPTTERPMPVKTAQAPPALPEPIPASIPAPAPTPTLAPVQLPQPVQAEPTPSLIPLTASSPPIAPPPPEEPKALEVEQALPMPSEHAPSELPPIDPYFANEENVLPPEPEPYQVTSGIPYAPERAYSYETYCDSCHSMLEQCSAPLLAPFATFGFKGGNTRVLGNGRLFMPLYQDSESVLFADMRGQVDDNNASEGNWGLGYRAFIDPEWIFGIYGYYDLLRSPGRNMFHQGTVGAELMSLEWDVRMNGYFPQTGAKATTSNASIVAGNIIVNNMAERAYGGFDGEIGKRFLHWGLNDKYEVRWFVGGYYFNNNARGYGSFSGTRTRIEFRVYDLNILGHQSRLETGFEGSYDKVREGQAFGFVRLRVPLSIERNPEKLSPLRRRLADLVVRDVDIVSQNAVNSTEAAYNPLTGGALGDLLQLTAEDDYLSAIQNSAKNAVIVLDGSKGEFELQELESFELKDGQTLIGGGFHLEVAGINTGHRATFNATGSRPTLRSLDEYTPTNNPSSPLFYSVNDNSQMMGSFPSPNIRLANHTMVSGLDLVAGGDSISGNSVSSVVISDVSISDSNGSGISINDVQDLAILDSKISNTSSTGISAHNFKNVVIDQIQIDGAGSSGVSVSSGKNLRISNSQIKNINATNSDCFLWSNPNAYGIRFSNTQNGWIIGNQISGVTHGIAASSSGGTLQILKNQIDLHSNNEESNFPGATTGISVHSNMDAPTNILAQNNLIHFETEAYQQGIYVSISRSNSMASQDATVRLLNNQITNLLGQAFVMNSNSGGVTQLEVSANTFQYSDIGQSDSQFDYQPLLMESHGSLFAISSQRGETDLTMKYNQFTLTGGGVNDHKATGLISSQYDNSATLVINNNSFPGEFVELFRDEDSSLDILSNLQNAFQLKLAENSQPISGYQ